MEPHSASPQHGGLKMRGLRLESVCQGLRKGESNRKPHQSSVREDVDRGVRQCLQPIPNQASWQHNYCPHDTAFDRTFELFARKLTVDR